MIKGAIFDMDGTVLDSMPIWTDTGPNFVRSHGKTPEAGLSELLDTMSLEESIGYMCEHYGIDCDFETGRKELLALVDDEYKYNVGLKDNIINVLEALQEAGVKMCVASSSQVYHIKWAFERLDIAKYFVHFLSCSDIGMSKNNPEVFDHCCEVMGTTREETVVFEDAPYALSTAKNAGFKTVGYYDEHSAPLQDELKACSDLYYEFADWDPAILEL